MTRPIYESTFDRENEDRIAFQLAQQWKVGVEKLRKMFPVDYALVQNKAIVGFLEIKCRTNPVYQYPDYLISMGKIDWCLNVSEKFRVKCILAVQWSDRLGWLQVKRECQFKLSIAGRTDRGDGADIEPCCLIPVEQFKFVN